MYITTKPQAKLGHPIPHGIRVDEKRLIKGVANMCLLRMVRLSLLQGLSRYSAAGFAAYGFLMATLGYHGEGYRKGKITEWLTEKLRHQRPKAEGL
jgi:hypothetical protein